MNPAKKGRQKDGDGVQVEVDQRAGERDPPEGGNSQDLPDRSRGGERAFLRSAARRLGKHKQQWHQEKRGRSRNQHRGPPAELVRDRTAEEEAQRPAHWNAKHEEGRSEEHTSELQSLRHLVCRLLLEKKK